MSEYRWPIEKLNDILQPMRETDLVVIGSRPSQGKTTLMLNMAYEFTRKGMRTAYATVDRSRDNLEERLLQRHRYSEDLLKDGEDEYFAMRSRYREKLRSIPLFFLDLREWGETIDKVAYAIDDLKCFFRYDICFVDYLQLIREREGELKWFKELATFLQMPIVIASQLKRTVMNNPGNLPQEKDFHDFEEINACADTIIMLHRERSYDDNAPKEELRVIVSRDRGKPVNRETVLHFDWEKAMLMEEEEQESIAR